ncbi:serine/threonine protein kinase [Nannizzia gypsea CBS 118893]|uniref:Serine/threonine protein kinase n=1 Tax=Arthroderma gypseum (strain ATCC MYA-4604 / CBS 118893) TaxID=535722 RepID=E4V4F2_ARTGP|nr:serine/threonine protein kinase [Nannizzia gypsea CBS 118893]EFR04876.1 serine/threonine protein kinase [Nannizzia gypsea CBS 118893]
MPTRRLEAVYSLQTSTAIELPGNKPASQAKENLPFHVYLAKSEKEDFVLKNVPDFEYLQQVYQRIDGWPHLRLPKDSMAERSMFVYRYMTADFLNLPVKTELPLDTAKRILRDALQGLAALHDNDIIHNDIKANNILVDQKDDGTIIDVRLGDIEDAAIVPPGCGISGRQLGNWMWRSPESHAEGPMTSPSDVFSFAIVITRDGFNKENPRKPFALWEGVDPVFKDLICRMTHFNPGKRITARGALEHEWFRGI